MKLAAQAALLAAAVFTVSCERKESVSRASQPALVQPPSAREWPESDFTAWMSRAELQYLQERNPADQYFARVEGREKGGMMEYRAAIKPFPSDDYDQWAVFWGIDEKELFDWELRLLKSGFVRSEMQIFADRGGETHHQIVWLKPQGDSASAEEPTLVVTSEQVLQEQASRFKSKPTPDPVPELAPPAPSPQPDPVADAGLLAPVTPLDEDEPLAGEPTSKPVPKAELKPARQAMYSVKPGDTLGKIARLKGVTVADLKTANGLKNDIVRIGQKLLIPAKR